MAKTELRLKYKSPGTNLGLRIIAPMMHVMIFFVILALFAILVALRQGAVALLTASILFFVLLGIASLLTFLAIRYTDPFILLDRDGISLPTLLGGTIRRQANLEWTKLRKVDTYGREGQPQPIVALFFQDHAPLQLNTLYLEANDIDQLVVALEVWGSHAEGVANLRLLKSDDRTTSGATSSGALSYTQLWQDELRRRFTATNFVPLEPGARLQGAHLTITRQLSFGGMSATYQASTADGQSVVLKESVVVGKIDEPATKKARELFARETEILSKLHHEKLARVLDHFVENDRDYLMLEYIPGTNLRQLVIERGPQTEENVIAWALQIADVLEFLHTQDPPVTHRDLTPDNLILTDNAEIKVIDFGAAKQFLGTATGTMIGKQAYVPPEQLRGKSVPASDFYALGCTMYFLLTGCDPYPLKTSDARAKNPSISNEMNSLVLQLTQMEPQDRIIDCSELRQRLINCSAEQNRNIDIADVLQMRSDRKQL